MKRRFFVVSTLTSVVGLCMTSRSFGQKKMIEPRLDEAQNAGVVRHVMADVLRNRKGRDDVQRHAESQAIETWRVAMPRRFNTACARLASNASPLRFRRANPPKT